MPSGLGWGFKKRPFEGKNQFVNWQSYSKELQEKAHIFGDGLEWLPESIWYDTTRLDYGVGLEMFGIAENVKHFLLIVYKRGK